MCYEDHHSPDALGSKAWSLLQTGLLGGNGNLPRAASFYTNIACFRFPVGFITLVFLKELGFSHNLCFWLQDVQKRHTARAGMSTSFRRRSKTTNDSSSLITHILGYSWKLWDLLLHECRGPTSSTVKHEDLMFVFLMFLAHVSTLHSKYILGLLWKCHWSTYLKVFDRLTDILQKNRCKY